MSEPLSSAPSERDGSQLIRRALLVLRTVAAGQASGVGLQDVAGQTGLARPTVHRILKTLVAEGVAEQHPRSRRYAIGEQVTLLALARSKRPALLDAAEAFVGEIAQAVGDTVFLTARVGDDALCLARRLGGYPVQVLSIEVGARRPLGVSSGGLAILSHLAPAEAEAIIRRNAPRFAPYRTTAAMAAERLAAARRQGYSCSDRGIAPGTRALSAPILDAAGRPIAALTVAAIRDRLRPPRRSELYEVLRGYGSRIAAQLVEAGHGG